MCQQYVTPSSFSRKLWIVSTVPLAEPFLQRPLPAVETLPPLDSSGARIGPNAVLQTLRATREIVGDEVADALTREFRFPEPFPGSMIPEAWFVALTRRVRRRLPVHQAEAVLRRAGHYTGDYVAENRIPGPFRLLLKWMPPRLAVPLLLWAFRRHAWTFAGSGGFSVKGPYPGLLVLQGPPTCGEARGPDPSGAYYEAAFQRLLELSAPGIRVRETACQAGGHPACHFRLEL